MKLIVRGSLGVFMTCVAAAVAAPSAAAGTHVPVAVPLGGLEHALPLDAPTLRTGVPVPLPGVPEGPRYVKGRMLPAGLLPQVPVTTELPPTRVGLPLPHPLSERESGTAQLVVPVSDLTTVTPGAEAQPPLTAPGGADFGLPGTALPQAGIVAPVLRGEPGAVLGLG
ncbi:hypothetical protein [Streptomyces sp. NPDC000410]|uniref:hypothetical protein n=1 Tax=Streptomyces sp. NPDC000410 TaxID=3154254 RepID=UPI00332C3E79